MPLLKFLQEELPVQSVGLVSVNESKGYGLACIWEKATRRDLK